MSTRYLSTDSPAKDYAERIKRFRQERGLTQEGLAEELGVSFATVNRWENRQTKPSKLYWQQLQNVEKQVREVEESYGTPVVAAKVPLDFSADPEAVRVLAEGERLSFGHLLNPAFATEISSIDPLPHQRIAVYDHMLPQSRLRFLLADDAGAGKTIMTGLYLREMLSRRLIRRILIVPPAGLVGNWRRELQVLFNLSFRIVAGADCRADNPFTGKGSDQVIVSVDTLRSPRVFERLGESGVESYDLVVFDEAHKLAANRGKDYRVKKTGRYKLAEALAGVRTGDAYWQLDWSAQHLLLLTATPHMGKDYPYYALWKLLEPEILATPDAFEVFPPEERARRFIRRTKEEMVHFDGRPLYPKRVTDTLGYELHQGEISEQRLYDETTDYLKYVYNKAKLLNREAARLAMSVFQRRLASSTQALRCSLERRIEKLGVLIHDVESGRISMEQLINLQAAMAAEDPFDTTTADEEGDEEGGEAHEQSEDRLLEGVIAASLADLLAEREQVEALLTLARQVEENGQESKFDRLRDFLNHPDFQDEKVIIFTEHRDTLEYLERRLSGLGYTGHIAHIHGGMPYGQREEAVERFRLPADQDGARFLLCTDAAGEGINLQFCWIMVNYDVPWNPARLEQRMGRIHRYGQKHDPVVITNLIAPKTREGKVLQVLLEKLERIREELSSDKVFDCIGRLFEGVSLSRYMELALTDGIDAAASEIDSTLTKEQVAALAERERRVYGDGGDVGRELPRLRERMEHELYLRLMPGYVRQYLERVAPLLGLEFDGDLDGVFLLRPRHFGAMDCLFPILETYPEAARDRFMVQRPGTNRDVIWLHPGEPVFERIRDEAAQRLNSAGMRGAVFVDPDTQTPYLLHLARITVRRRSDPELEEFHREEILETRLVAARQEGGGDLQECPVERLLLLKPARGGLPPAAQRLAMDGESRREEARSYLSERVARELGQVRRRRVAASLAEREHFLLRGYDYREAELAAARARHRGKARKGNRKAIEALEDVKSRQRELGLRRDRALAHLRREPELIGAGEVEFIAHVLVVPSQDPVDKQRHDAEVEEIAMGISRAYEEAAGATVHDVHTPDRARAAGLTDYPGFDMLSIRPDGERRGIEVKGRAAVGDIEVSANEWARACNLRDGYWIYAVYDCAGPAPRLARVRDPFGCLLAKAKGSMILNPNDVLRADVGEEI